jgi:hypothetical protein
MPWSALTLDTDAKCFRVDITAQQLKDDPAFDTRPLACNGRYTRGTKVHQYYNRSPYWSATRDLDPGIDTDI